MKTLSVKVIDNYEGSSMNVGCFDVELTTKFGTIEAFVNESNHVSVRSGVWLHGLFGTAPFKSEFVRSANDAVQVAFKNWNQTITELQVDI